MLSSRCRLEGEHGSGKSTGKGNDLGDDAAGVLRRLSLGGGSLVFGRSCLSRTITVPKSKLA